MKEIKWLKFAFAGVIPVIWLALLIAPLAGGGLPEMISGFSNAMRHPFRIEICDGTLKTVMVFLAAYALGILIAVSSTGNYRNGVEMGSAKWGNPAEVSRKYADADPAANKILTQNVRIGLDGRKHRRNLNIMVVGGSGAGKTRFVIKPNIMQANTSMVILDPKAETVRATAGLLEAKGYVVRVVDLINMDKSHCYNPFVYIRDENDVQRLVTNLFRATTPKGSTDSDPFWSTSASMLLMSLMFYLLYEAPPEEQNFAMVMELLRQGAVDEVDPGSTSNLDRMFNDIEAENPGHIAAKYYRDYRSGSAKTLKSIQITLASRLEKFNLEGLAKLTMTDELELSKMGERKTALFLVIPDNDTSFNFLISMLYTQLFQQLFYVADHKYGGRLPVHVQFLMDEFSNIAMPDDFDKILSVMRSREVSVAIILQNLAQLKTNFEKQYESVLGNCDEFLYLGGNEQQTHRYVSELMGKETIDVDSHNRSFGRGGNFSTNSSRHGRELMDPSEVRMLDNEYALLFVRGEKPVKDKKYNIMSHPNVSLTEDGGALPYEYGVTAGETARVSIDFAKAEETREETAKAEKTPDKLEQKILETYEFISEEELMEEIKKKQDGGDAGSQNKQNADADSCADESVNEERSGDEKNEEGTENMYEW